MSKKKQNRTRFDLLVVISIFLVACVGYFFYLNLSYQKILAQKPQDIQITDVTISDAWVYWKSSLDSIQRLYYKELSDSKLFNEAEELNYYVDHINENRVYAVHIEGLKPDTQYQFKISSNGYEWDKDLVFQTTVIPDEIKYPDIENGNGSDRSLILVEMEDEKHMFDTQYHGTYAFDSKGKEYTATQYSTYVTPQELKARLSDALLPKVFAASGANCKTRITINSSPYPPSKAKTVDIINRWTGACLMGGYPEACYEDVYCRSLKYGINPAFVMTIWAHESGGSNYAYDSIIEDFGIHGYSPVPVANFDKQIEHFLNNIAVPGYISSCKWDSEFDKENVLNFPKEMIMWAARYWKGQCSDKDNLRYGYKYISDINQVYGWFTNSKLTWPFTVAKNTSACSYTTAVVNTSYNSCTEKDDSTDPYDPPDPDDPPVGDKKWLPITGIGNDGKEIEPEVDRECENAAGCICIWNYNIKPNEITKEAKNGNVCTVAGEVITSPPPSPTPKCGTGSTTYPSSVTAWPDGVTLCEVGNAEPSTVTFPKPGKSSSWKCVSGSKKQECKVTVTDAELECCLLSEEEVGLVEKGTCEGKVFDNVSKGDCKAKKRTMVIKVGVNFSRASEIVNSIQAPIESAKSLIQFGQGKILLVGAFENSNWSKIVTYNEGAISGSDFNLEPGKVYLIVSTQAIDINLVTVLTEAEKEDYNFDSIVGWNLVPSTIFDSNYYDSNYIFGRSKYDPIKQIAVWNELESQFDYAIKDDTDDIYGIIKSLQKYEGLFIRGF